MLRNDLCSLPCTELNIATVIENLWYSYGCFIFGFCQGYILNRSFVIFSQFCPRSRWYNNIIILRTIHLNSNCCFYHGGFGQLILYSYRFRKDKEMYKYYNLKCNYCISYYHLSQYFSNWAITPLEAVKYLYIHVFFLFNFDNFQLHLWKQKL